MPIPIPDAVREQAEAGEHEFDEITMPVAYGINTMLAGSYIVVAVVLMLAEEPTATAGSSAEASSGGSALSPS